MPLKNNSSVRAHSDYMKIDISREIEFLLCQKEELAKEICRMYDLDIRPWLLEEMYMHIIEIICIAFQPQQESESIEDEKN